MVNEMIYINRIKTIYKDYRTCKNDYHRGSFLQYLFIRKKYKIKVSDYFENNLYRKDSRTKEFLNNSYAAERSWNNVAPRMAPTKGKSWMFIHRIDFELSKLIYPGLDGANYFLYEFYKYRRYVRKTFITEGYLHRMDAIYNSNTSDHNPIEYGVMTNKKEFNTYFSDIVTRKWISVDDVSVDVFKQFCLSLGEVLVKPEVGTQGKGVFKISITNEQEAISLFNEINGKQYLVEEIVQQHKLLSDLNPSSVNTIRVCSVRDKNNDEIVITGAVLRIGRASSIIDNYTAGGLATEVDVKLGMVLYRTISHDGEIYYFHPDTGVKIIGFQIPNWNKVIETVKNAHQRICEYRYISWDVVVCSDGTITLLEANTCGGVDFQQQPSLIGKKPLYDKYL